MWVTRWMHGLARAGDLGGGDRSGKCDGVHVFGGERVQVSQFLLPSTRVRVRVRMRVRVRARVRIRVRVGVRCRTVPPAIGCAGRPVGAWTPQPVEVRVRARARV